MLCLREPKPCPRPRALVLRTEVLLGPLRRVWAGLPGFQAVSGVSRADLQLDLLLAGRRGPAARCAPRLRRLPAGRRSPDPASPRSHAHRFAVSAAGFEDARRG